MWFGCCIYDYEIPCIVLYKDYISLSGCLVFQFVQTRALHDQLICSIELIGTDGSNTVPYRR